MSVRRRRLGVALSALGAIALSAILSTEGRAQASAMEPDAARILKRMTDYVAGLQKLSVDTDNMFEEVLDSGQKIQRDFTTEFTIQRPNKLRADRTGDLFQQLIVYDGKTFTIHNRADNYYAETPAPADIDGLLHFARDSLDIIPPAGDIMFKNAYELLTTGVTSGVVIGKSLVGGVRCDHLAFTGPVVDWQIWIADGDKPLPHKYVLTTRDDPAQPQYILLLSNWNVAPKLDDAFFAFTPPKGGKKIDFLRVGIARTSGR